jgi:cephalosporin-C deacetylase
MDTRGQTGSRTPDTRSSSAGPGSPGWVTDGILDPEAYYYRRVYSDAVRAVETARAHPDIDSAHVAVTGRSQGGGITLAVSGLVPDLVAALPEVPFLCNFARAVEITDRDPYAEIVRLCQLQPDLIDQVFATLQYFDGINFAARANAPAQFSVALMDPTCPPSCVYSAYNHYAGPKQINVWKFNIHEGAAAHQAAHRVAFLHQAFDAVGAAPRDRAQPAPAPRV